MAPKMGPPEWAQGVGGLEHPNWPEQYLVALLPLFDALKAKAGKDGLLINLWSDCGGMATMMSAAVKEAPFFEHHLGIPVKFRLYQFCDKAAHCREYVNANFKPTHVSPNMFDRNFDAGTFLCSLCDDTHDLPPSGCAR